MKQTRLNALMLIGMIGVLVIGSIVIVQLYRAFGADQDIWWTASTMPLKIDETKDTFELFINGKSIQDHLADGTLLINRDGNAPISSSDITIRLNNWYKIKSSILAYSLLSCFMFGACLTMLITGLIRFEKTRDKN